jgi:protein O-mannosyl-transferase
VVRFAPFHVALFIVSLGLLTFLVYLPALGAGFIWDDDAHVTAPALRSWSGLSRIWFEVGATQQYYPLLHTAFWIEHRLWGSAPFGYHLVNILLHVGVAATFGLVLRRLTVPGWYLAATVVALHPVHVESVAWISEQKNTLSTLFYLGAALVYLRFVDERKRSAYLAASVLFGLALLTKTVTATLPAALLVVLWWRRGRLRWRKDVLPLIPWLLLGATAGLFTAWIERTHIGALGPEFELSLAERCLIAGRVVWFYLGKLLWPVNLTFNYPRWEISASSAWQWLPLSAALAAGAALWHHRKPHRAPLAAALIFVGSLFPVLGFFNVYPFRYSYVADHFQYLASLSVIAFIAAGWTRLPFTLSFKSVVAAAVLIALGAQTSRQAGTYLDSETLFRATLARNPSSWLAHNNLGQELQTKRRRVSEAIAHFEQALELQPDYPEARNNLGLALTQVGRSADAIPHLEEAVRLKPSLYQGFNNLGIALASSSRAEESLEAFARAAALNPQLPNIRENWAKALLLLGREREAAEHFAAAAQLRATR